MTADPITGGMPGRRRWNRCPTWQVITACSIGTTFYNRSHSRVSAVSFTRIAPKGDVPMKVLFIGGTGKISSACTHLAVEKGIDLYLLNRGQTDRPVPEGVHVLQGDIRDPESARRALHGLEFDAVVNWIAFTPDHVETDLELFRGRTGQYLFISSASAYQKPPNALPITESTLLANPFWLYLRNKIACEDRLVRAYHEEDFPFTVVRPSHTYDRTMLPFNGGYTVVDRMRKGKPVIVHGDGTSLWVLTHHRDFAKAFVGLLGNNHAIGDAFHITSDELLTWNQITTSAPTRPASSRSWCMSPRRSSTHSTRTGAPACSATKPTASSSTTPRSNGLCRTSPPRFRIRAGRRR